MRLPGLVAAMFLTGAGACNGQDQVPDTRADVRVAQPRHRAGEGSRIVIDAAHHNFHTATGRYAPFAALLRNDGHRVASGDSAFTDTALAQVDILVVASAGVERDRLPFTPEEVDAVVRFVERGGGLFLIVDHAPFPAAAQPLAAAFGVTLRDNFVGDDGSGLFTHANGGLTDDPLLQGLERIRSFTGSSFIVADPAARPLLRLGPGWTQQTPLGDGLSARVPVEGELQGAVLTRGRGRVAVFSEAGMFTAQRRGWKRIPMGFNEVDASGNKDLALRLVAWLGGEPGSD